MTQTRIIVRVEYHHRSLDSFMGRFGGGWNWMLGFRIGGNTVILHCLVFDIVFSVEKKEDKC